MRIVFMGSPEYAVPTLRALVEAGHDIPAVYTQPPRAAGRGKALRPTAVHDYALDAGLEVRCPLNFRDEKEVEAFSALNADLAVVIAYGLILPKPVLDAPRYGAVNLHASLLPRWRGAAPIQRAIMSGDNETGVCLMKMSEGLDEGPIFASMRVEISDETTAGGLHDILAELSARLLMSNIEQLPEKTPVPQTQIGIIYARKISKAETPIDWTKPSFEVVRHIHGLSPFPGAWTKIRGERVKFHNVISIDSNTEHKASGQILDDALTIACGDGAVRPLVIQREGKKAMPADEVLRGLKFDVNETLGGID